MIQTDDPAAPQRINLTRTIGSHHLWKSLPPFVANIVKEKILDKLEPEFEYLVYVPGIIFASTNDSRHAFYSHRYDHTIESHRIL